MKGLFVKDLKLMKGQNMFLMVIIFIAVGLAFFAEDVVFPLSFPCFVTSLISLSTISYDEFDNGNAFLFTLPITRKDYVIEKYALGFLMGCGSWLITTLLISVTGSARNLMPLLEIFQISLMILPMILLLQALMIPFQLKFGAEKGRIAILSVFASIFLLSFVFARLSEWLKLDLGFMFAWANKLDISMLIVLIFVIAVIIWLFSIKVSISIIKKKEF